MQFPNLINYSIGLLALQYFYVMSHLKTFARFIIENRMQDLVYAVLKTLRSSDISLKVFSQLTENELQETTQRILLKFLTALETAEIHESATQNMILWEDYITPGNLSESEFLLNIVLVYEAEKTAILNLIPEHTADSFLAVEIIQELEHLYKNVQKRAWYNLQNIQRNEQIKLAESEERYRDLFDNASDMIHIVTPEGEILYVNNAWSNAIGYTHDELRGKSIYSFVAEEERVHFREHRQRVVNGEMHLKEIETCFISKDGREVIVEGSITCRYKDGKPTYTRGILRNITNRKLNEKKLQFYTEQIIEREENIRQLVENAPDAVIVIDERSTIILWNPKAEQIFGWSADEVIGSPLAETIIPVQYREAHSIGMKRLLSTGEARVLNKTIEITALNKNNEEFYVSLTISRSRRSDELAFIAFIRDISEQKKNEQELEKKRIQLEKNNFELEQFAKVASHDLKEPLRKILTFSDLLLTRHKLSIPVEQIVTKIDDSANRMNELIKGILLYSNVSDERQLFEPTDLNAVVNHVLTDLELIIMEKKAQIHIEALPSIEAVAFQMRQLFQNLISNSLKYSKHDTFPVIEIFSKPVDQNHVEIRIKDNGIGFEKAYNEKIFQVFQRLSTPQNQEGTGIGLALCKKITQIHGGLITASGHEGAGAIFTIILPYRRP